MEVLTVYLGILLMDFLRYFITAGLAYLLFWILLKKRLSHLFIQQKFPEINKLWFEFKYSMCTVFIFSLTGLSIYYAARAGYTSIYTNIGEKGLAYFILSIVLMIVFHDFYFYWSHRLMHHPKLYRYVHKVHHHSTNPSPWAAYSFHPIEGIIEAGVFYLFVFFLPVHTLALFIFLIFMIIKNVLGHLGFEIFPKNFLKIKWLNWNNTVTHHNLHHRDFNCNYGLYFTWWDNWMGTSSKKYNDTFDEVKLRTPTAEQEKSGTSRKKDAILFFLILLSAYSSAQGLDGLWMTFDERNGDPLSVIKIDSKTGSIQGSVFRIYPPPEQASDPVCSGCSGSKKDKKIIGMVILKGFKKNETGWTEGFILDPSTGTTYASKLWLEGGGEKLKVRGYGGPLNMLYKTQTWLRNNKTITGMNPVGQWKIQDEVWGKTKSIIEIKLINNELRGTILDIFLMPHEGDDPVCMECEGELKNKKIVGMKIMEGFVSNGGKWTGGFIMDPGNGKTYKAEVWLEKKDELKVRGYLGPFYRTQVWKRVMPNGLTLEHINK